MNDRVPFLVSPLAHIPGDKFPSRSEASLWLLRGQQAECPRQWCHLHQGRDPRQVYRLLPQFTDIAEPWGANCDIAHGKRPQVHHWQECELCQQGVWPGQCPVDILSSSPNMVRELLLLKYVDKLLQQHQILHYAGLVEDEKKLKKTLLNYVCMNWHWKETRQPNPVNFAIFFILLLVHLL